jgi:protein O-mannosyl-transferase
MFAHIGADYLRHQERIMRLCPSSADPHPIGAIIARKLFIPVTFAVLVLLGYLPALHTSFLADDFILLAQAQIKYTGLSILAVPPRWWFYRPLSAVVWQYTFKLFGYHPFGYHLFSLGLHWINSLLVVALVRRFALDSRLIAPGAGLLFALLPLHPETVIWLSSQFDLLATIGYLAALYCLLLAWGRRSIGCICWRSAAIS